MSEKNRPFGAGEESELIDKVIHIARVAKVVKGGRRFHFSALVVVGDGKGRVGVALGKATEVPEAIRKGIERAKKSMFRVPIVEGGTIPYQVIGEVRKGPARVVARDENGMKEIHPFARDEILKLYE